MKRLIYPTLVAAFLVGLLAFLQLVMAGYEQVNVCHIPPGNPGNAHVIGVSPDLVPGHLAHGDCLAPAGARVNDPCTCPPDTVSGALLFESSAGAPKSTIPVRVSEPR